MIVELITRKIVDEIVLIPAGDPQLREAPEVDGATRLEMCKIAVEDLPIEIKKKVSVSDLEINRNGPSFAIDTIEALEAQDTSSELFWIIGSDAYAKIESWHRWQELEDKVNFIVIDRPGDNGDGLDIGALNISATKIRNDNQVNGTSPSVRKYITERKLYASK